MRLPLRKVLKYCLAVCAFASLGQGSTNGQSLLVAPSFEEFVTKRFSQTKPTWSFEGFCPVTTNLVAERVLREYGSIFASSDTITLPDVCIFGGEAETLRFQKRLQTEAIDIDGVRIVLQSTAAAALRRAAAQAAERGRSITPFDGAIAGSRSYGDTLRLWNSRFFSGMNHWIRLGRLTEADREAISRLDLQGRIVKIMEWESLGIWFSTDRTKSIFMSVAPPGASQHLSYIAFDVAEYGQPDVRQVLNQNGWYQTVIGDPVHFTFLEVEERELPNRGLRAVAKGGHLYWVPNLSLATN